MCIQSGQISFLLGKAGHSGKYLDEIVSVADEFPRFFVCVRMCIQGCNDVFIIKHTQ